ncbi:molybdenum cofactor guanylyltransferase [Aquimarina sp. 2201CG1-2-11]|uniref:molybdenum cofactor guanylyltransferase n=1 Tax=Aquimarina discodermiae TaxID=3231043 RepID=UPI003461C347
MNIKKDITAIVLAGGKSSRMGSEKGLVLLKEKPFINHIINAVKPLVKEIVIVSSNTCYDDYTRKRIEDSVPNAGPVAGLLTGLRYSETENNIVLSCDVPMVTTDVLKKLLAYKDEDYDVVQFEAKGKTIPLIALYKKRCEAKCAALLSDNERRLRRLILSLKTKTIKISEKESFYVSNINTMGELKIIENAINH